jgi:hypothetical protein
MIASFARRHRAARPPRMTMTRTTAVVAAGAAELSEAVGGHSHDTSAQVDDVMEAGRGRAARAAAEPGRARSYRGHPGRRRGAVRVSGAAGRHVAQTWTDALTAWCVPAGWVAFALAHSRSDERMTYGYGRAEDTGRDVSSSHDRASQSVLRSRMKSVRRLIHQRPSDTSVGCRGRRRSSASAGKRTRGRLPDSHRAARFGSAALVADGAHARTDGFTESCCATRRGGVCYRLGGGLTGSRPC